MKVYVDDMLEKSLKVSNHLRDLREVLSILRKYKMKLNSRKYAFSVSSRKFLGFIVN